MTEFKVAVFIGVIFVAVDVAVVADFVDVVMVVVVVLVGVVIPEAMETEEEKSKLG